MALTAILVWPSWENVLYFDDQKKIKSKIHLRAHNDE